MNTQNNPIRFNLGSSFGRICYYPANELANATLPKKRVCLRPDELVKLIDAGQTVEVNLSPYLFVKWWVTLNPSNLPENA